MKRAVVLVALAACGGKSAPAGEPAEAPPRAVEPPSATLRFDWSPPCRVPVTERSVADGHEAVFRYVIEVRELNEYEITVDNVDYAFVSIDGKDLSGPQQVEQRAMVTELASLRPTLIVDREGRYLRADGMLELIEIMLTTFPPDKRDTMRQLFSVPETVEMLADKSAAQWVSAVSVWTGVTLEPGKTLVTKQGTMSHLGVSEGYVRLRYEERLEGEAFHDAMAGLLLPMFVGFQNSGPGGVEYDEFLEHIQGFRETTLEVVTDPETLRPRRSTSKAYWELQFDDLGGKSQREVHELDFDWAKAEGCGT